MADRSRKRRPAKETGKEHPEKADETPAGEAPADEAPTPPDWLERSFSWASGLLVLALLANLLWDAAHEDRPAAFETTVERPVAAGTAVHVPVLVRNTGDRAVQGLEVTVTLESSGGAGGAGGAPPEASFTLDWLAGRSERRGVAVFPRASAEGARATAEVTGFGVP